MNARSVAGCALLAVLTLISVLSASLPTAASSGAGSMFAPAPPLPPPASADAPQPVVTRPLSLDEALKLALQ